MRQNLFFISMVLAFVMLTTVSVTTSFASPAPQAPVTVTQPDGRQLTVRMFGDEFGHFIETLDGYTVIQDARGAWTYALRGANGRLVPSAWVAGLADPSSIGVGPHLRPSEAVLAEIEKKREAFERGLSIPKALRERKKQLQNQSEGGTLQAPGSGESVAQSAGGGFMPPANFRLAVLLIEFPSMPHVYTPSQYNEMMFSSGTYMVSPKGAPMYGSMNDYYSSTSYGQFSLSGDVYPWVVASYEKDYYNTGHMEELVHEAVTKSNVDLSLYDAIAVIYPGVYGSGDLWPHMGYSSDGPYYMMSEFGYQQDFADDLASIGSHCHEFGHLLGLPDMYTAPYALGAWELMANGGFGGNGSTPERPTSLGAWSKEELGWALPTVLTEGSFNSLSLSPWNESPSLYKVVSEKSYFLVSYNKSAGYDLLLPEGMLIWHINPRGDTWTASNPRVNLVRADGTYAAVEPGDPFPGTTGNTYFGCTTTPASTDVDGSCSAEIYNIALFTDSVTFSADVDWPTPGRGITLDGTGDYPALSTAMDASIPGQTVIAPAGLFEEKVVVEPGVNVVGAGPDQTVLTLPTNTTWDVMVNLNDDSVFSGFRVICPTYHSDSGIRIYMYDGDNGLVANNVVEGCSFGLELQSPSYDYIVQNAGLSILNNILYDNSWAMYVTNSSKMFLENNVFLDNQYGVYYISSGNTSGIAPGTVIDYNNFYGSISGNFYGFNASQIAGSNNIYINPLLTDVVNGNYAPLPGSPLIDAGAPYVSMNDTDGSRNDIGVLGGPYAAGIAYTSEICYDGFDNDGDGYVDGDDSDCSCTITEIPETSCIDGLDNDCDGYTDESDLDCSPTCIMTENPETSCADGQDNDCDGFTDNNDGDCFVCVPTATREKGAKCSDGLDNDCDGYTDAEDPDCGSSCTVTENPEVSCTDGQDNDCDGYSDANDPDCSPSCTITEDPEVSCTDGLDNDCDGYTDSNDSDCSGICVPTAPKEKGAKCSDGLDNDCDGLIDGADPDC